MARATPAAPRSSSRGLEAALDPTKLALEFLVGAALFLIEAALLLLSFPLDTARLALEPLLVATLFLL